MQCDQRVIIPSLCKERVSREDIHAHLEAGFGDTTYSERSFRRWCQYVQQGREGLHTAVRFGRRSIDFLHIRILPLLDERPFRSAYLIAQALGIFRSTISSHLRAPLGMKVFYLRWIPHELTTKLR
jgi:hypothetical protein